MTDPEGIAQDISTAAPAATPIPAAAPDLDTQHDPAVGQASVTVAPRKRRRLAVFLVASVVVLALAVGLVVWAPWKPPPPVLRPTGLVAGSATAYSIEFHWSSPPTGPLPDKYLILGFGMKAESLRGTVTSYRKAGLTPSSTYIYHVVAVRAGKRSPPSAALSVTTITPPISAARLQGGWQVYGKNLVGAPSSDDGYMTWQVGPVCAVGACDVSVHVTSTHLSFKIRLAHAGSAYKGQTVANIIPCGPRGSSFPDPTTVTIQIRVNTALGKNQEWVASAFTGTMVWTSKYVSSSAYYCPANYLKVALNGAPS